MKIKSITLTVRGYGALDFCVSKLGFERAADSKLGTGIRRASVAPNGAEGRRVARA